MNDSTNTTPAPAGAQVQTAVLNTVKPGWQTTEFWLSGAATILPLIVASGLIPTSGDWPKMVALAISLLGAMGYTAHRNILKTAASVLMACLFLSLGSGCASTSATPLAAPTINTLAATAGQAAAIGWVAAKSPTASQQHSAVVVLQAVSAIVADTTNLDRFATAITPALQSSIASNAMIPEADKPAVSEGIALVVAGADLYASQYTGTLTNLATRAQFITYFCNGAISVLSPDGTSWIITQREFLLACDDIAFASNTN